MSVMPLSLRLSIQGFSLAALSKAKLIAKALYSNFREMIMRCGQVKQSEEWTDKKRLIHTGKTAKGRGLLKLNVASR